MNRAEMEKRYPGLFERLGTVTDAALAREYKLSAPRICHFRTEHDIAPAGQRKCPSEAEWAELMSLKGEITIGADRRTISVGGNTIRGRTLRQAVMLAIKGAK